MVFRISAVTLSSERLSTFFIPSRDWLQPYVCVVWTKFFPGLEFGYDERVGNNRGLRCLVKRIGDHEGQRFLVIRFIVRYPSLGGGSL
jgi:hypothetical protein